MARLPALIDDLAKHDTRGRPSVELIARTIREAGLIRTTKRGRGAAEMSARDTAALLVGLCVAETPSSATEAVRTFLSLAPAPPGRTNNGRATDELPSPVKDVAIAPTFGDAISSLIINSESISSLSNMTLHNVVLRFKRMGRTPSLSDLDEFVFSVGFRTTEGIAYVAIQWVDDPEGAPIMFGQEYRGTQSVAYIAPHPEPVDRRVEINLGPSTFIRLGALVNLPTDLPASELG